MRDPKTRNKMAGINSCFPIVNYCFAKEAVPKTSKRTTKCGLKDFKVKKSLQIIENKF